MGTVQSQITGTISGKLWSIAIGTDDDDEISPVCFRAFGEKRDINVTQSSMWSHIKPPVNIYICPVKRAYETCVTGFLLLDPDVNRKWSIAHIEKGLVTNLVCTFISIFERHVV